MAEFISMRRDGQLLEPEQVERVLEGNKGKPRLLAMSFDNLIAIGVSFFIVANIPNLGNTGRGSILIAVYLLYFLISEGLWSRTPMKWAFGLVVRRTNGDEAGWKEAVVRTFLRVIEVNPLLLGAVPGGLAVLISERHQRLGDMLAGSVVVLKATEPAPFGQEI